MVIDNVVINKSAALERAVAKLQRLHGGKQLAWVEDELKQDSIILTLQQACELAISLSVHVAKVKQLGIPQTNRDGFDLLVAAKLLSSETAASMKRMVGFRNIAIHEYQKLNFKIVDSILEKHLDDFIEFLAQVRRA
jgi:uncharacterized protein YutE (UPF0331/DUF86 family)